MRAALRYRRAQGLVIVVLSALVTLCLVLAPLYTRALDQALVRTLLSDAAPQTTGLQLTSFSPTEPVLTLPPDALAGLVPDAVRGLFGVPVGSTSVDVRRMPLAGQPGGRLLTREGMCNHVGFTSGRCPTASGEIAVSAAQAAVYSMPVGAVVDVGEFDGAVSLLQAAPHRDLRVVGVYAQVDSAYWFGDELTGRASKRLGFDTMLTPPRTLTDPVTAPSGGSTSWFALRNVVDVPLVVGRVGADEIAGLGATVGGLVAHPLGAERSGSHVADTVTVRSGLPGIADEVRTGSAQAAVTVPLLMAQMELLLFCVLWLVLVAAADQRRGEVAVARLRGRGSRGAARLVLGETLPQVVLGVPLGALLAVACSWFARHTVLTSAPPFEVPIAAVGALAAALAAIVGLTVLSVRRVCREPVSALLRSVPPREQAARLGVREAMVVAGAGAGFLAVATGTVGGPVGQGAPVLLAVAVGIVASRVLSSSLGAGGRRLLLLGWPTAGTALLSASRRGTIRWLVPIVTVALSIAVVTADVLAVGARNWAGRAAAEVGATTVLRLDTVDLAAATSAVRAVDPGGDHVTPVAVISPTAPGATATVGVVPSAFRRIALWPGVRTEALAWDRLTAPTTPPLPLDGSRLTFHVTASQYQVVPPVVRSVPTALVLGLRVVHEDGTVEPLPLATIPRDGVTADQVATVGCADGCRLTGIGVLTPRGTAQVTGTVTLSRLTVDGRAVDLGAGAAWRDTSSAAGDVAGRPAQNGVLITYTNNGFDNAFLDHASLPGIVPALTTHAATPSAVGATFAGSYVDGGSLTQRSAGAVPFVPGGPASASIVNVDNLLAQGWRGRGSAVVAAYLDTADPTSIARVTSALAERGVHVVSTTHVADVAASYRQSAAGWSLELARAIGVLSLLVAAVAILVLASTSGRARRRDYAVLRLFGQSSRRLALLAQLETVPVIATSAVLGAVVGLWAAPVAVGMVPIFASTPPTFPVDLTTAWGLAISSGVVGLAALALVGALTSHRLARMAEIEQLREFG